MYLDYSTLAPVEEQGAKIGRLVRHLKARLEEFDCVTVEQADETTGKVLVLFAGFSSDEMAQALGRMPGITVAQEAGKVLFFLRKDHRNESNDSIWGGLYRYICIEAKKETE